MDGEVRAHLWCPRRGLDDAVLVVATLVVQVFGGVEAAPRRWIHDELPAPSAILRGRVEVLLGTLRRPLVWLQAPRFPRLRRRSGRADVRLKNCVDAEVPVERDGAHLRRRLAV